MGLDKYENLPQADYDDMCAMLLAAPEMCRALLELEVYDMHGRCVMCAAYNQTDHIVSCRIDSALTKAGLDTQEKRDDARKEMGI